MSKGQQISIYGKSYTLKSAPAGVDVSEVAAYVDERMKELSGTRGKTSTMDLAVLTALNIAQDLMELQRKQGKDLADRNECLDRLIRSLEKGLEKGLESINSKGSGASDNP